MDYLDNKIKESLHAAAERIDVEAVSFDFPKQFPAATKMKPYPYKRIAVAAAAIFLFSATTVFSEPVQSYISAHNAKKSHASVVMNGFFYEATGNTVSESSLIKEIGEVERSGEWNELNNGDTTYFNQSSKIYALSNTEDRIAIQHKTGTGLLESIIYLELQKSNMVPEFNPNTVVSAKSDDREVGLALENDRKLIKNLYTIQKPNTKLDYIKFFKDFGPGVLINYRIPEADEQQHNNLIEGRISFIEYNKKFAKQAGSTSTIYRLKLKPKESNSLEINGIKWMKYEDDFFRGEKDDMYYEVIEKQGNVKYEQIIELLHYFKPLP